MLQKSSSALTLEVFFTNPTQKHNLMDISRRIKIAHTSVKRNLMQLVRTGLVIETVEKKGMRKFPIYVANLNNNLFKRRKRIYNIDSFLNSGLIESVEEKIMPKSVVVFGSYQRGEDTEESDIDVFIESKEEHLNLKKFERKLKRKIQLHFNPDFKSYPTELKNNILNGVVVFGFLEGYK
jgi:predicted nucleotidyltransferase